MSDENKSQQASEYKLREARKRGQVSKSIELTGFGLMIVATLYFSAFAQDIGVKFSGGIEYYISNLGFLDYSAPINVIATNVIIELAFLILPFFAVIFIFAILLNVIQVGLVVSFEPLEPKFEKLNPVLGLKKIFSRKNLFELIKQVVKLSVFSGLIYFLFNSFVSGFVLTSKLGGRVNLGSSILDETMRVMFYLIAVLFPITIIDFIFSRLDFKKEMMMSEREVREEYKKKDGDPQIKSKRKQQQNELSKKFMGLNRVKTADVVVNNPTHISVALKFDAAKMVAPEVVASGKGYIGAYIRKIATKHSILQITDIELARGLFFNVPIGQAVSEEYFKALVPIYRKILGMDGVA